MLTEFGKQLTIRARLAQLYGNQHSLAVGSPEQGGARIALIIPYRSALVEASAAGVRAS